MSNLEQAGKAELSAARTGARGWMSAHPFTTFFIGAGAGAAVLMLAKFFLF